MTTFYFIRHGQADFSEANTKIYKENGIPYKQSDLFNDYIKKQNSYDENLESKGE